MNVFKISLTLLLATVALSGCDGETKERCQKLADHLADVLIAEKGEPVDDATRKKMVDKTVETCVGEPPKKAEFDCAMAAGSSEAMKACDPKEEE